MKKTTAKGICWLLVACSLLMSACDRTHVAQFTDPTADSTEESKLQIESTPTTEATDPTLQITEPDVDPTDPTGEPTDPVEPTDSTDPVTTEPGATTPTSPNETTPTEQESTKPTESNPTTPTSTDHYVHSGGKSFENMTFSYAPLPGAVNIKDQYTYQSLGSMEFEDYPIDGVYDQAFNCIKVGDTYKMWWGRACPYDTIWYAESKDMKHWYNAQCIIDLKGFSTNWIKEMLLWSTVLYVDGQYHMFFETPASFDGQGEYNNNICYATSPDGIHWTFYPDNENPQPVIKNPSTGRNYGVGQPKAFYKDGAFYIVYTDASDGGGRIRVAKSEGDPFHFGDVSSHPVIMSGIAGASVRYNETTGKYYMLIAADVNAAGRNSMGIYIQESEDLYNWPYSTMAKLKIKGAILVSPEEITKKANPDFVTNDKGIVVGDNMIFMYMDGVMPSLSEDHRNTHTTWDGRIGVLSVDDAYGKEQVLPNGKSATEKNLIWYQDLVAEWVRPSLSIKCETPVLDGVKDSIYTSAVLVESVTWEGEHGKPTSTTGTANLLWDNDALYMFITVNDKSPKKNGDIDYNDSVTLFISPNSGNSSVDVNCYWITIDLAGNMKIRNGKGEDIAAELTGLDYKVKSVNGGYTVEVKLPWYGQVKDQVKKGASIGMDICITDNIGMTRNARVFWSDFAGYVDRVIDRYGMLTLS